MNNWKGKGSNLRKVSNDLARLCGFKMQKGIAERIWCKDPGREARIEAASRGLLSSKCGWVELEYQQNEASSQHRRTPKGRENHTENL